MSCHLMSFYFVSSRIVSCWASLCCTTSCPPWLDHTYKFPIWFSVISAKIFHIACKSFIQPDVIPPQTRHNISKPLSRKEYPQIKTNLKRRLPKCRTFRDTVTRSVNVSRFITREFKSSPVSAAPDVWHLNIARFNSDQPLRKFHIISHAWFHVISWNHMWEC